MRLIGSVVAVAPTGAPHSGQNDDSSGIGKVHPMQIIDADASSRLSSDLWFMIYFLILVWPWSTIIGAGISRFWFCA